jgi:hypothetical protein
MNNCIFTAQIKAEIIDRIGALSVERWINFRCDPESNEEENFLSEFYFYENSDYYILECPEDINDIKERIKLCLKGYIILKSKGTPR